MTPAATEIVEAAWARQRYSNHLVSRSTNVVCAGMSVGVSSWGEPLCQAGVFSEAESYLAGPRSSKSS